MGELVSVILLVCCRIKGYRQGVHYQALRYGCVLNLKAEILSVCEHSAHMRVSVTRNADKYALCNTLFSDEKLSLVQQRRLS